MQSGGSLGMQSMYNALMKLVSEGRIAGAEAFLQANNKAQFERMRDED